ncbi:hypothetical protein [Metallibacterium scheffleri]|uniref:hypothetical protein n=1 Tax=Metallibacterium scheffleri TaxID=993689 RepID=UPI0023F2296A|nr:hypothetical protein [Metallibacterium scheffleri]
MNIEEITDVGVQVLRLLDDYSRAPAHREMLIDPILYAFLKGKFGAVARQHHVAVYGSQRPKRIDFRVGGTNPVVLELAVRSPKGVGSLLGKSNTSELRKLCKVSTTQAKLRALLLIDLYGNNYTKDHLQESYEKIHAGPGKFERNSVRVIYVHMNNRFDFSWSPFK